MASPYRCSQGGGIRAAISGDQAAFGGPYSKAVGFFRVQEGQEGTHRGGCVELQLGGVVGVGDEGTHGSHTRDRCDGLLRNIRMVVRLWFGA